MLHRGTEKSTNSLILVTKVSSSTYRGKSTPIQLEIFFN